MYRIRLESGEQTVFRSAHEMSVAVQTGVVGPSAMVFHTAARRWLPVGQHPDYRAGLAAFGDPSSSGSRARHSSPSIAGESEYDPSSDPTPVSVSHRPTPLDRTRRVRIALRVSLTLAALALGSSGGYHGARLAERWIFGIRYQAPVMTEGMSPAPLPASPALGTPAGPTDYPSPSAPAAVAPLPEPALEPVAEQPTQTTRLSATRNTTPSYFEAYADARAEMEDEFDYIGFRRLFDSPLFSSPDSIRASRRMLAAASNIVAVYRSREVRLEQTYRPDAPEAPGSLRETFEAAQGAAGLLSEVDSLFGVLQSSEGRYSYDDQSVKFVDPAAALAYGALRQDILARIQGWRDLPESSNQVTIPRLLTAVGPGLPPPPAIR